MNVLKDSTTAMTMPPVPTLKETSPAHATLAMKGMDSIVQVNKLIYSMYITPQVVG